MSYSFDGANDFMAGTFASTYAKPVTLGCYVRLQTSAATDCFLNVGNSSSSVNDSYQLRKAGSNDTQALSLDSAGANSVVEVLQNIDDIWTGVLGVFINDSLRRIYVGDVLSTADSTALRAVADVLQFIRVGESLAASADYAGLIAEVVMWDFQLDAVNTDAVNAYLTGTAASHAHATPPVGYWPLSAANATQANEGSDAGGDLTVTGAIFDADHPTITIPSSNPPTLYVVRSGIRLA